MTNDQLGTRHRLAGETWVSLPDDANATFEWAARSAAGRQKPTVTLHTEPSTEHLGHLFGNFRIIRRIGSGGMGVVYEAEHRQIGRRAAVKVLHPWLAQSAAYATRFLNEARAVNIIGHPGLVEIFEYGQQPGGTLYIVMEFLFGETLRARLEQRKDRLPVSQVISWAAQIAGALAATHAKGVIHRDLKPENIMIVPNSLMAGPDRVKILDFGIAKLSAPPTGEPADQPAAVAAVPAAVPPAGATVPNTGASTMLGTPIYMAPEQHSRGDKVDSRADVFTFGVILYEMLSGELPYKNSSVDLRARPAAPLETLRVDIPKMLTKLIQRMLAPTPAKRPPMVEVEALLTVLASPEKKPRRTSLIAVVGSILLVLVGLCGVLGYRLYRPLSLAVAREPALTPLPPALRNSGLEPRKDAEVVVRSRVAELGAQRPAAVSSEPAAVALATGRSPAPTANERAAPPSRDPAPPTPARGGAKGSAPTPVLSRLHGKALTKPVVPPTAPASNPGIDPQAKNMGLIQIYVLKNGRCQLANQYYLPPGEHIINLNGEESQTVSVYAGTTTPIRQCP